MKHLFIVNPIAGKCDQTDRVRSLAEPVMARLGHDFEVYVTQAPMDACAKIREEAACADTLRVYACGGDGTLNECVNGAVGFCNVAVAHFPCGTGNDFIKTFGEKSHAFFELEALINGHVRAIDLISCGKRSGINICSAGFDARVTADVHKYSSLPVIGGKGGYIISLIFNMIKGISEKLSINTDGFSFRGDVALVCACNGSWYGGSFNPMPDAEPDDGYLDFLIVHKLSRINFLRLVGKYAAGRYRELGNRVTYIRGKRLDIEAHKPFAVNLDGELIAAKRVSFEVVPGGINFIFPAGVDFFEGASAKTRYNTSNHEISAN